MGGKEKKKKGEGGKVEVSKGKILLTVLSPCKQKVELTEVCKAGSHEPSL